MKLSYKKNTKRGCIFKEINIIHFMSKDFFDQINQNIKHLFEAKALNTSDKILMPWFYSPSHFKKDAEVLFVWMNPAGREGDEFRYLDRKWISDKDIEYIVGQHNWAINWDTENNDGWYLKYYWIFTKLFWDNWNSIDLFVFRWTNQKELEILLDKDGGNKFFLDQYNICISLINYLNPKIIVFVNAAASKYIMKKWYSKTESEISMNWCWNIPDNVPIENKKIPVLFTSMLSWQRALDVSTRSMLVWNINRLIGHK